MGLPEDWLEQVFHAYTVFGIRRWIPNIDPPDKNPEFEKEHPREEKGQGVESGRFERKPRASTDDDDEPRAEIDYDIPESPPETGVDDATYDMQTAQRAGYAIQKAVARHGLKATQVVNDHGLEIELHDQDGKYAGKMIRRYEYDQAEHEEFMLEKPFQGKGVGTDVQEALEDFYRERGITDITLTANADVGGYAWAKLGYNFDDIIDMELMVERAERALKLLRAEYDEEQVQLQEHMDDMEIPLDERAALMKDLAIEEPPDPAIVNAVAQLRARFDAGGILTPIEFAMIGHEEGLKRWFGKELMLGSSWEGRKEIR